MLILMNVTDAKVNSSITESFIEDISSILSISGSFAFVRFIIMIDHIANSSRNVEVVEQYRKMQEKRKKDPETICIYSDGNKFLTERLKDFTEVSEFVNYLITLFIVFSLLMMLIREFSFINDTLYFCVFSVVLIISLLVEFETESTTKIVDMINKVIFWEYLE